MKAYSNIDKTKVWILLVDQGLVCNSDGINGKLGNSYAVIWLVTAMYASPILQKRNE